MQWIMDGGDASQPWAILFRGDSDAKKAEAEVTIDCYYEDDDNFHTKRYVHTYTHQRDWEHCYSYALELMKDLRVREDEFEELADRIERAFVGLVNRA